MKLYRTQAVLTGDGKLMLDALPFRAGDRVDVVVLAASEPPLDSRRNPLLGLPYRYDRPTDPVAEEGWEALR